MIREFKNGKPRKIIVFDDFPKRHDKILFNRVFFALKDKYKKFIIERGFNINDFKPVIEKEIRKLTYLVAPNYDKFFIKMERLFLKELSNFDEFKNYKMMGTIKVDEILGVDRYEYNVHFPLGRLTLRNMIINENELKPVDKYSQTCYIKRPLSKPQIRANYFYDLMNRYKK